MQAEDDARFQDAWLQRLMDGAPGAREAVLVWSDRRGERFVPVASRPEGATCSPELVTACERVLDMRLPFSGRMQDRVVHAQPVSLGDTLHGVVALGYTGSQLPPGAREWVSWGVGWLLARDLRSAHQRSTAPPPALEQLLDLMMAAVEEPQATAAVQALVTEAAVRLGCDRVSVGFGSSARIKFEALSHSADVVRRIDMVRAIEAVMNESAEQGAGLSWPPTPSKEGAAQLFSLREHERLAREFGSGAVLSAPFAADDQHQGVFVFEWAADQPPALAAEQAQSMALVLGRVLLDKRQADRGIWVRLRDAWRTEVEKLLGPRHAMRKFLTVSSIGAIALLSVLDGEHRVSAEATLEGAVRRQITAPFDGFVSAAHARAGQTVKDGELLATLDDRDMRLETLRWESQQEQFARQTRDAEAQSNLAQIQIGMAQTRQARAQRELSAAQLARARVLAPFAGVIVSGDLSQSLGSAVRKGQTLFEIAPLDDYRIILEVPESDFGWVQVGQKGQLVLTALTGDTLSLTVSLITPVAVAKSGHNVFRVEATLDSALPRLRPGMEGVAKVTVGERKLIWIWTHGLWDWLRLLSWTWLGL